MRKLSVLQAEALRCLLPNFARPTYMIADLMQVKCPSAISGYISAETAQAYSALCALEKKGLAKRVKEYDRVRWLRASEK